MLFNAVANLLDPRVTLALLSVTQCGSPWTDSEDRQLVLVATLDISYLLGYSIFISDKLCEKCWWVTFARNVTIDRQTL